MERIYSVSVFFLCIWILSMSSFAQYHKPGEPVRYLGADHTANSDYADGYHDGQMKPAIGVQNYQILRSNRSYPELADGLGWTYHHAPNLAYWNGKFYCHYLSNPTGEHVAPGATLITESADGKHWDKPRMVFPIYFTSDSLAGIHFHFMHQRMGFYVAPDGRLLTFGFYGGHKGDGIGRVVREIYADNELGPIYFIRINDGWKGEVKYPFYTESPDKGFVEACDAFLDDRVRRMQWWEEHRLDADREEFFRVPWLDGKDTPGQAFTFYTLPDSSIVGFFKDRWVTLSHNEGESWTRPVQCKTLTYRGAKIWGQHLDNGRYALVYNPTDGMARHPLSIATSDDGLHYNNLLNVHVEVPPKRYWGHEKRPGPQYVRGITEGNGNPPGDELWVVYSVTKEDLWISRIPVPVSGNVEGAVRDDFDEMERGGAVTGWNIYSPRWCPVEITASPDGKGNALMLRDYDPFDYGKALRVFQGKERSRVSFRVFTAENPEILAMEIVGPDGSRCIQTMLDTKGQLLAKNGEDRLSVLGTVEPGKWVSLEFHMDSGRKKYSISLNGEQLAENLDYAAGGVPERIIFRTGEYRLTDDVQKWKSGDKFIPGWDETGAGEKNPEAIYFIKDFRAE